MKQLLTTITAAAMMIATSTAARENALEKEMEDYARDFFRAHPEAAGDERVRNARDKMVQDIKMNRILELSKEEQKKLRRREDPVSKRSYTTALNAMKALNSQDPKITFLITYAENTKIKPDEKLLAYRLMEHYYQGAAVKAAESRSKRLHTILAKYTAYKASHGGKAPASLDDLDLPDDCEKFVNSKGEKVDWIYIGHLGARLKTNNSHVVIAEPEPLGTARVCGLDNGDIVRFNNSSVQEHLDKFKNATATGGPAGNSGGNIGNNQNVPSGQLAGVMKKYRIFKELNNNKEPSSVNDLNLKDKDKTYTDPDTGEKLAWIFLGKNSRIRASDGVTVIIVSPKPYKDYRLVGLSNGKIANIPESKIGPLLNK